MCQKTKNLCELKYGIRDENEHVNIISCDCERGGDSIDDEC